MKKLYNKVFSIRFFANLAQNRLIGKFLSYEILSYIFFGVMTTLVSFVSFFFADKLLGVKELFDFTVFGHVFLITTEDISTLIAWIFSVVFAYVTNKIWVFESFDRSFRTVIKEFTEFVGARILSFVLFESLGFMVVRNLLLSVFGQTAAKWIAKIAISVFVIVFNYVMSKLVIFRKEHKKGDLQ